MKLPINQRLLACCDFVRPGDRVADIGCDHGYLGLHLLMEGIARQVIAADLRPGPLDSARKNAQKYGFQENIQFYLSNGVQSIPRTFDVCVCAGMGAETMISILAAAPWLKSSQYRLILQCQTKTHLLRQYLSQEGWFIRQEVVRRDGKFRYTVMEVLWDPAAPRLTPGGCFIPPVMAASADQDTQAHCRWVYREMKKILDSRGCEAPPLMAQALCQLEQDPQLAFLKEDTL